MDIDILYHCSHKHWSTYGSGFVWCHLSSLSQSPQESHIWGQFPSWGTSVTQIRKLTRLQSTGLLIIYRQKGFQIYSWICLHYGCSRNPGDTDLTSSCPFVTESAPYLHHTQTHQQKGWKSVNLAHPFSSASVAAALVSGVPQAEKPPPAAGAFEFTSPKSAIQPVPENKMHHTQTLYALASTRRDKKNVHCYTLP